MSIDNTDFPSHGHLPGRRGETISTSSEPVDVTPLPDTLEKLKEARERQTDSWFRECNDGRLEIMCKAPGFRIRVTAPEAEAWQAVELFEQWTGLTIQSERRPRRKVSPPRGQMSMTELESGGSSDGED